MKIFKWLCKLASSIADESEVGFSLATKLQHDPIISDPTGAGGPKIIPRKTPHIAQSVVGTCSTDAFSDSDDYRYWHLEPVETTSSSDLDDFLERSRIYEEELAAKESNWDHYGFGFESIFDNDLASTFDNPFDDNFDDGFSDPPLFD